MWEMSITESDRQRFWEKVEKLGTECGCWLWMGGLRDRKCKQKYGAFVLGGKQYRTHRIAFLLTHGCIQEGMHVCHTCDTPECVNPSHLFQGTHQDNMLDKKRKGRIPKGDQSWARRNPHLVARGDRNGAKLHPECLKRGEEVNTAKLTPEQVLRIREKYENLGVTQASLAVAYGVHDSVMCRLLNRKTWKHL
jgi:hypothetical protein